MGLITVTELRTHIETDLSDAALQRLIDAADMEIRNAAGDHTSQNWISLNAGWTPRLYPPRPVLVISYIKETEGSVVTTLQSDDYRVLMEGRILERLSTGTNPRVKWAGCVEVQYQPVDDIARRIQATIDLVKLSIRFSGVASEQTDGYQEQTSLFMLQHKKTILAGLKRGGPGWA